MTDVFELTELAARWDADAAADEAAARLADADAEADRIRSDAYAAGRAAGEADARAEIDAQLTLARAAVDAAREWQAAAEERFAHDATDLALAVAEKLVDAAIAADRQLIGGVIRRALRRARNRERLTLVVAPCDVEAARALVPELASALGAAEISVVDDRRVARGGCLLETPAGEVDGTIVAQLERAREAIRRTAR